jgi:protoheme IX farnesyltransferase
MAAQPFIAASNVSVVASRQSDLGKILADYWAMTKPEVNFLIGLTTAASFYLASAAGPTRFPWVPLLHTLVGTLFAASGAAALNQWAEYPFDAKMRRTARRPIAGARIDPDHALTFGATLSIAGVAYLGVAVGFIASVIALLTVVGYLLIYTPLKRVTPLCTLVGAAPGAAPPLIGWAAARGHLDPGAWLLFSLVFLWQFPHFMSIAWMYRADYNRAGYRVLPDDITRDHLVIVQTLLPLLALLLVSLLPVHVGQSLSYSIGALVLGCWFFASGARFTRQRSATAARRLLTVSIIYLPSLLLLMILGGVLVAWE